MLNDGEFGDLSEEVQTALTEHFGGCKQLISLELELLEFGSVDFPDILDDRRCCWVCLALENEAERDKFLKGVQSGWYPSGAEWGIEEEPGSVFVPGTDLPGLFRQLKRWGRETIEGYEEKRKRALDARGWKD